MRLWSIHPQYLDARGLVALWREGLLAQNVLMGKTRGYRHHPQLLRFRRMKDPVVAINHYLRIVAQEATARDYQFDLTKLAPVSTRAKIPVTTGQLQYEFAHLLNKLKVRDPARYKQLRQLRAPLPHPMFRVIEGEVESWEVITPDMRSREK